MGMMQLSMGLYELITTTAEAVEHVFKLHWRDR
jgi:hypothetical protein